jgi:hypothetical protein
MSTVEPYRARPAIPAVPGAEVTITSEATKRFLTIRIEAWDADGNALVADNTRGYLVRSSDFDVDAQFGDETT